jgi:rubrerythrin
MSDIWQEAKDIETKGKAYYEQLAAQTPVEEVKSVLKMLAGEEQKHYDLFDSMQKGMPPEAAAAADVGKIAKEEFTKIAKEFRIPTGLSDAEEAYRKALSIEQASISYYSELLGKIDDKLQQSAIETVISEEKRHEKLVLGLVEFVRRPKEWLENAEFYHLEEY